MHITVQYIYTDSAWLFTNNNDIKCHWQIYIMIFSYTSIFPTNSRILNRENKNIFTAGIGTGETSLAGNDQLYSEAGLGYYNSIDS